MQSMTTDVLLSAPNRSSRIMFPKQVSSVSLHSFDCWPKSRSVPPLVVPPPAGRRPSIEEGIHVHDDDGIDQSFCAIKRNFTVLFWVGWVSKRAEEGARPVFKALDFRPICEQSDNSNWRWLGDCSLSPLVMQLRYKMVETEGSVSLTHSIRMTEKRGHDAWNKLLLKNTCCTDRPMDAFGY